MFYFLPQLFQKNSKISEIYNGENQISPKSFVSRKWQKLSQKQQSLYDY
jgi:hypothetical protein